MRILITSIGTATSVNLIKELKKRNHFIVGVDINDYGYTAGSLMVDSYIKVPLAINDRYLEIIKNIIVDNNVDLLIPINDVEVESLSREKESIGCSCVLPDINTVLLFRDKLISALKMKEIGIDVPTILDTDDITKKRILKKRTGVGSKEISIYEKGTPCRIGSEEILQEFVDGIEYTVDVLSGLDGTPFYIIPRERLETKSGVATKVRIYKDERIIELVKLIMKNYPIPGFCNVQFIKSDNHIWFIEVNTRFSGCGIASTISAPAMIDTFLDISRNMSIKRSLNESVKWNAVITRYYEEKVFYEAVS